MNDYEDPIDLDDAIAADLTELEPDIRYAGSAPIGGHVVDWRTLTDRDARTEWQALRAWVEWFTVRYRISESVVPPCWYQHGHLVEELSALHAAHTAAFDRSDTGFGPIGFHERLSLAIPRLSRAYFGGCARGHDPAKPRSWNTNEQEWDAWTCQAHAH
ncbi:MULTISPECIES: hypothetical protein [unclassified Microbacterium]|uniref:hypothetical protein n=1 Tax=unclassified Microbacterium TaxID=2609290 RepID=UPI0003DE24EC|nr:MULTISPECIES: hypothetical protein [unclassified Microbacterium]CDJ99839.1 hypothetical protein MIC448_1870005 [Microbacterium sp. C448]